MSVIVDRACQAGKRRLEDDGPYAAEPSLLDRHLLQVCSKPRLLELIHDFVVFDAGTKKLCRQNQYFGVKASQDFIRRREGGIIWHTQGSGKSLTMMWLAKWIPVEQDQRLRYRAVQAPAPEGTRVGTAAWQDHRARRRQDHQREAQHD